MSTPEIKDGVSLDAIAWHAGCESRDCPVCIEHADTLFGELRRLTGNTQAALLSNYHRWLLHVGIPPETDGGWWSREALSDANAQRFAKERAAFRRPLEHCQCPACRATIHSSDCAVHNMPAMPNGPCDCGAACEVPAEARPTDGKTSAVDSLLSSHRRLVAALTRIAQGYEWSGSNCREEAEQAIADIPEELK